MSDEIDRDEQNEALARLEEIRRRRQEEFRPLEYEHANYRWDRSQEKFWDLISFQLVGAQVVDKSIPEEAWRLPEREQGSRREPRPIRPSADIPRVRDDLTVHSSTWHPGMPQIIENMLADEAGYSTLAGAKLFNTYRAPRIGKAKSNADPWIELVKTLFPNETEHTYFFDYCAHMIQRPGEKCNAGVVLSGTQGVGKDAILMPLKECVGFANAKNIGPDTLFSEFNEFVRAVMLVVDEVRSHSHDHKATAMYNKVKELCAAPPNMLRMNLKKLQPVWVANLCRLFMTTNEVDSMFLPRDDRRMFVLHTDLVRNELESKFKPYWDWLRKDGAFALHEWLSKRDLSDFNASAEPPKTAKHIEITGSWGYAENSAVAMLFNGLRNAQDELPDVISAEQLRAVAADVMVSGKFGADEEMKLQAALLPRSINRTMTQAGYLGVSNPASSGGAWQTARSVGGKKYHHKANFYRRDTVPLRAALEMAAKMLEDGLSAKIRAATMSVVEKPRDNF
jgi:hypothetical protein